MSEGALRAEPAAGRVPLLERAATAVLERGLAQLEGGTLEARLPTGELRRFGSGPTVRIDIHDLRLLRRIATRGSIGLGESYMADEWDASDMVALFELLLANAAAAAGRHSTLRRLLEVSPRPNRRNGLLRARRNIEYHYDLGNDLFELMLDETMTYSCAVWDVEGEPLADAQRRKLRRVCDKLELGPEDRVLEIGCGWGSFAILAAQERGCRVTGLTLSPSQAAFARERIRAAGVEHLVEIREEDYRTHAGSYSKVASIEMLEAIGEKQFGIFFAAIDRFLEPGGAACVQTILIPDGRWERYRRKPDWIERYIFPGCLLPSLAALATASGTHSRLLIDDVEEIGPGYAETLKRWRENFDANLGEVRALGYDRRFERTWRFYLAFCEAGFRTRVLRDAQLTLRRAEGT